MAVVTSINLMLPASGSTNSAHVTVADQNGNPVPPANITWDIPNTTPGTGIIPDATGFNFEISVNAPVGTLQTRATYNGPSSPSPIVGSELSIVISEAITSLEYLSP